MTEEKTIKLPEDWSERHEEIIPDTQPARRGYLSCKCACGNIDKISEEVLEDGLNWTMLVGDDHFLTLNCQICGSSLTMFIEEIHEEDEFPKESNKE